MLAIYLELDREHPQPCGPWMRYTVIFLYFTLCHVSTGFIICTGDYFLAKQFSWMEKGYLL